MSATKHPEKSKTKLGTPFVTSTMGLPHAVIVIAYGIDTYVVGVWSFGHEKPPRRTCRVDFDESLPPLRTRLLKVAATLFGRLLVVLSSP